MHISIRKYTYIYIYIRVQKHIYIYIYLHLYIYTYTYTNTWRRLFTHLYVFVYTHMYIYIHMVCAFIPRGSNVVCVWAIYYNVSAENRRKLCCKVDWFYSDRTSFETVTLVWEKKRLRNLNTRCQGFSASRKTAEMSIANCVSRIRLLSQGPRILQNIISGTLPSLRPWNHNVRSSCFSCGPLATAAHAVGSHGTVASPGKLRAQTLGVRLEPESDQRPEPN